jgi:hypothetical protein
MNLVWLIFAHYVGDFWGQSAWVSENKGKYWYIMLAHCIIWTACICIALQYIGLLSLWKIPFLIIGHGLMDYYKTTKKCWYWIYSDQLWHLVQVLIVYDFNI